MNDAKCEHLFKTSDAQTVVFREWTERMHKKMEATVQFAVEAHNDFKRVTTDFRKYKEEMTEMVSKWRSGD